MEIHDSFSEIRTVITVQVCHEHKKIDHGLLDYGMGYNGTILDGSVVMFRCYTGLPKACNYLLKTKKSQATSDEAQRRKPVTLKMTGFQTKKSCAKNLDAFSVMFPISVFFCLLGSNFNVM